MGKIYAAAIMQRHHVGDGMFVFYCSHAMTGEIDEKTKIFKDIRGNEYSPVLDDCMLRSEISNAYFNPIPVEKLVDDDTSLGEALKVYEKEMKNSIYLVGLIDGIVPFIYPVETNGLKESLKRQLIATVANVGAKTNKGKKEENKAEEESMIESDVEQVIIDINNNVYSNKQLKQLRKEVETSIEASEQLIETINLRLGDRENEVEEIIRRAQAKRPTSLSKEETKHEKVKTLNIRKLYEIIRQTLIGQDEALKKVLTEIQRKELCEAKKREAILLTGPTGVGKTKMMELISKNIDRPIHIINSTKLTIPGYVGTDIEEELWKLYEISGCDKEKAENAIVIFDEIDKKGSGEKSDVSGRGVLNLLLSFIEGSNYTATESTRGGMNSRKVELNTKNMIVILCGAFTDVYKNLTERNEIGIGKDITKSTTPRKATTDDFIEKAQFPDEFMGRVRVVELNPLDYEGIKKVLTESDESQIKVQKEIFEKLGVKITFTDDFIDELAIRAEKKKTGARGLNGLIDEATSEALFKILSAEEDYEEVLIGKEALDTPDAVQYVKRRNRTDK